MANLAPITVRDNFQALEDALSLTAGNTYLAQHVGGQRVQFTDYPTDPTSENISRNSLGSYEWMEFTAGGAGEDKTWVATDFLTAMLAVKEKP